MPRILDDEPCTLILDDKISNSKLTLMFRIPTTEERTAYSNALITRRGNKVEYHYTETRVKYGINILTGFGDGDFYKAKDKPLSWRLESPDYDPEWKEFIRKKAADVLELLAIHVFELSVVKESPNAEGSGGETGEPEENPT